MNKHVCQSITPKFYRMVLDLAEWNTPAYDQAIAELGACAFCLRNLANVAIHQYANELTLRSGGLDKAACVTAGHLAGLVMNDD